MVLAYHPVVAELAAEVAPSRSNRHDQGAGVKVAEINDIKTLGPTHATELVTTISSIVAVSKFFAPLVFVLALVFAFIWIFYGTSI